MHNLFGVYTLQCETVLPLVLFARWALLFTLFLGKFLTVLDAGSLNIPVVASKIPSFIEIQKVINNNQISLFHLNEDTKWLNLLNKTEIFNIDDNEAKNSRIEKYSKFCEIAKQETTLKIKNLISN